MAGAVCNCIGWN